VERTDRRKFRGVIDGAAVCVRIAEGDLEKVGTQLEFQ